MTLDSLDKKVQELLKKNPKLVDKAQKSTTFIANLKKEVEKLMECIKNHTNSETVKNSIYIKEESDGTFTITFDKTAIRPSIFTIWGYPYPADAYMPLLRNEGYQVKHPKWKKFFGDGAYGTEERFIELGIQDYKQKYGNNLNIKVEKIFDQKYSAYNEVIDINQYY